MGTITKALDLLNYFSESVAEIGLTDFTKLSGRDKATVHRHLNELMENGFLEQNTKSRQYRLGPAILRLSAVRERTFPARFAVAPVVDVISSEVGELVHVSLLQSNGMSPLYHKDAIVHGTRVYFDEAMILPLHATSSGIAMLAFGPAELLEKALVHPLKQYTNNTITKALELTAAVESARNTGVAFSNQGFEEDVCSLAVPVYNEHEFAIGTLAIALPISRLQKVRDNQFFRALTSGGVSTSAAFGGVVPDSLEAKWQKAATANTVLSLITDR